VPLPPPCGRRDGCEGAAAATMWPCCHQNQADRSLWPPAGPAVPRAGPAHPAQTGSAAGGQHGGGHGEGAAAAPAAAGAAVAAPAAAVAGTAPAAAAVAAAAAQAERHGTATAEGGTGWRHPRAEASCRRGRWQRLQHPYVTVANSTLSVIACASGMHCIRQAALHAWAPRITTTNRSSPSPVGAAALTHAAPPPPRGAAALPLRLLIPCPLLLLLPLCSLPSSCCRLAAGLVVLPVLLGAGGAAVPAWHLEGGGGPGAQTMALQQLRDAALSHSDAAPSSRQCRLLLTWQCCSLSSASAPWPPHSRRRARCRPGCSSPAGAGPGPAGPAAGPGTPAAAELRA